MWYKHHISLPAVLITSIITLLVSGSDEFLFTTTPLGGEIIENYNKYLRPHSGEPGLVYG